MTSAKRKKRRSIDLFFVEGCHRTKPGGWRGGALVCEVLCADIVCAARAETDRRPKC